MEKIILALRRFIYRIFFGMDFVMKLFHISKPRVIVLCYHSISPDDWRFSVSEEAFKEQIEWFRESGYQFFTLHDIEMILHGEKSIDKPSVVLTFDDGYNDILSVKGWLYEKKIYPIAFVLSESDQATISEVASGKEFLSKDDLQELRTAGWGIGCHSATHADFSMLSSEDILREVKDAKLLLESEIGVPVTSFAYPKGFYSQEILGVVKSAGYTMAFSMNDGSLEAGSDVLLIPRIGVDCSHTLDDVRGMIARPAVLFRMVVKHMLSPKVISKILGLK